MLQKLFFPFTMLFLGSLFIFISCDNEAANDTNTNAAEPQVSNELLEDAASVPKKEAIVFSLSWLSNINTT